MLYILIINRRCAYGHYAPCSYYPQRVHIWSLYVILFLSTEGRHMVIMLHALIIHRGSICGLYALLIHRVSSYGHYTLYSYYQQKVRIWLLCSILLLSTEGRHIVIMLYTLIINIMFAYGYYALFSYYPQKVGI